MSVWFCDYESYSECDIKALGAHAYALHPSTRLLLAAVAKDDGPVLLWDHSAPSDEALELIMEMAEDDGPIVAHNVGFEAPMSEALFAKTFHLPPPAMHRWVCTAAMCRRAAIPWSLHEASRFLNLSKVKMETGHALIKWFCVPQEKPYPKSFDKEASWAAFRQYCITDVESERLLYHRLRKSFALPMEEFAFDMRMNQLGLPVNRDALRNAQGLASYCMGKLNEEFERITGLKVSQREAVLQWLKVRGYPGENLQAKTMEGVLEDPPETMDAVALRALELRAGSSFASLAKIPTMLAASEHDGRVRGGFLWSGALRTHRWAGRIVQPQNFKRPSIKDTHLAYEMIKRGEDIEAFEMMWEAGVPEIVASCVRHFIEVPGKMILDADYSNIEARITPWLCGQEDMLDEFRNGEDIYVTMAAYIFNTPREKVSKDQRFVGKQACLAAQYQVGWKKFQLMCAQYGRKLDDDVCKLAINKYREKRDKVVAHWAMFNNAAKEAIRNTGHVIPAGRVSFAFGKLGTAGFHALQIKLPSGHKLTYPLARLETVTKKFDNGPAEIEEIQFWGPHPTKSYWAWQSTYGGKIMENCVAGDSEVLTARGWVRIDSVTVEDVVWDGFEFVNHGGLKKTDNSPTIDLDGLDITADHLVYSNRQGWSPAATVNLEDAYRTCPRPPSVAHEEHHRPEIWPPHSARSTPTRWMWEDQMERPVRLRHNGGPNDQRVHQGGQSVWSFLPVQGGEVETQNERAPSLLGVAVDARSVPTPHAPSVEELRGKGDQGVRPMERIIPEFLGGYGSVIRAWAHPGKGGQRSRLLERELRVGKSQGTEQQSTHECVDQNPMGGTDSCPSIGEVRHRGDHTFVPDRERRALRTHVREAQPHQPVYDLINCGPRHQFVVRGKNKRPLIIHNCVQAIGGDFMTHGLLEAERRGYRAFATIHDQALVEQDEGLTPGGLREALCVLPPWAEGFPLEATAEATPFYTKD